MRHARRWSTIATGRLDWHRPGAAVGGGGTPRDDSLWHRPLLFTTEGGYGEQVEDQGERPCAFGDGVAGYPVAVRVAQRVAPARAEVRLWSGAVRCLLGVVGREGDSFLCDPGCCGERQGDHNARGPAGSVGE